MSEYLADILRLQFDLDRHTEGQNILTSAAPAAWRGTDWAVAIAAVRGAALADVSLWGTLTLRILPMNDLRAAAYLTKTAAASGTGVTLNTWVDGSAQHALFNISATESLLNTVFTMGIVKATLAIVVTGVTTESNPRKFVVGKTTIEVTDVGIGTW